MKRSISVLWGPAILSLLGLAFCAWIHLGSNVDICVTAGCTLYQDTTIAGVSLWNIGMTGFALMALLAITRYTGAGYIISSLGVLADIALLALMVVTAPCVNCLIVACFLILTFLSFRNAVRSERYSISQPQARSLLALVWSVLFLVNLGQVAKAVTDVWSITGNEQNASVRMYFSPSCSVCRDGIARLSGHAGVAFFPVAEKPSDLFKVAAMQRALAVGASMHEAFGDAERVSHGNASSLFTPEMLLLRLRLLRNQAHVYQAGSRVIPFFEFHGLPAEFARASAQATKQAPQASSQVQPSPTSNPAPTPKPKHPSSGGDASLPIDMPLISGFCTGTGDCNGEGSGITPKSR